MDLADRLRRLEDARQRWKFVAAYHKDPVQRRRAFAELAALSERIALVRRNAQLTGQPTGHEGPQ